MSPTLAEKIDEVLAVEPDISTHALYAKVGGSYPDLVQYVRERRTSGRREAEPPPPPTLAAQLQAAQQAYAAASRRLAELRDTATRQILSEGEETEQLRLQQRLSNVEPVLARLQQEHRRELEELDIADVCGAWSVMVEAKRQAYAAWQAAWQYERAQRTALLQVHRQQEALMARLPERLREAYRFPAAEELLGRLASRFPQPDAWQQILHAGPLTLKDWRSAMDTDGGLVPLNPRAIERYRQERAGPIA